MDEDNKSEEMIDSFTITGNKEICEKFDHNYCAAPREERSGDEDHFTRGDGFLSSTAQMDRCDHIAVSPVGAHFTSEAVSSSLSVESKAKSTKFSGVVLNTLENPAMQEHCYCVAPQEEKLANKVNVDVEVCDHIVVSPVGTFSTAEGDSKNDCAKLKVGNANACKDACEKADEGEWDGSSADLKVGLTFQSRTQVREFLALYGNKTLCKMVVAEGGASDTSKSRQIKFACSFGHGKESKASTTGRPVQHSKKKGCPAYVRFYCRGNKEVRKLCVLTAFSEEHNHAVNKAMYFQEVHKISEPEENEFVAEAMKMNVTAAQLKNHIKTKYDKSGISTNHVRYIMSKLRSPDVEKEDLSVYLEKVVQEGGDVCIKLDNKQETVRVMTIQTNDMRKAYSGIAPNLVYVDTTFNFNKEGYKMSSFAYLNPVTNKGEIAQLIFLTDEGADALEFAFSAFKGSNAHVPGFFMVDKDFNEVNSLKTVFPKSSFLLCQFHVMKYMKSLISTAQAINGGNNVDYEKKSDMMEAFRVLMYASTEGEAHIMAERFDKIIEGVQVRVGNGDKAYYANLRSYFDKNWRLCSDKWLTCKRKNIPGLEDENTNNRLERLWRTMKDYLKGITSGLVSINKAVVILVNFAENQLLDSYTWQMRHSIRIAHQDPKIAQEYTRAAVELNDRGMRKLKDSVDLLFKKEDMMEVVEEDGLKGVREKFTKKNSFHDKIENLEGDVCSFKTYKTTEYQCNCSWSYRSGAPCRHVLFMRRALGLPLFESGLFSARFLKQRCYDLDNNLEDESVVSNELNNNNLSFDEIVEDLEDVKQKVLNRGEKYRLVKPLLEQLQESMIRCGTQKVESFVEEMQEMLDNVKNGNSLLVKNSSDTVPNAPREEKSVKADEMLSSSAHVDKCDHIAVSPVGAHSTSDELRPKSNKFNVSWQTSFKAGRVGRPKESKVKFIKRKSFPVKQKITSTCVNLSKEISRSNHSENEILCTLTKQPEKPQLHAIYVNDLDCLSPKTFITNDIVDFKFKLLQPNGPSGQRVWLISPYLSQLLHEWIKAPTLASQVEAAKLFDEGGCEIVLVAQCENSHFFGIVGVCGAQPAIFVLESIGGYPHPSLVKVVHEFMQEMQQLRKIPMSKIDIHTPAVPRQLPGSNDCGIFLIENATKIIENPADFISRAYSYRLDNWYPSSDISNRRTEIAKQLHDFGQEQRRVGQVLQHLPELVLNVQSFDPQRITVTCSNTGEVLSKKPRSARKCGICREIGHSRKRCPMKENIEPASS